MHSHSCPVFQGHPVQISSCYRGWGFPWDYPHVIQDSRPTMKHDSFASYSSSSLETTLSHSIPYKPETASLNSWNFDRVTLKRNVCTNQPVFEVLLSFVNLGKWETVTLMVHFKALWLSCKTSVKYSSFPELVGYVQHVRLQDKWSARNAWVTHELRQQRKSTYGTQLFQNVAKGRGQKTAKPLHTCSISARPTLIQIKETYSQIPVYS